MRHQRSNRSRAPLFGLLVVGAATALALLFLLAPVNRDHRPLQPAPAGPPPLVTGGPQAADGSQRERALLGAAGVGRRFLRLYVRLQITPPDKAAQRELRSLTSMALAETLLAQPAQSAGGERAHRLLGRVRVEALSSSDVRLHAAIREGRWLLRVRCLVQHDQGRWAVTALTAAR